MDSLPAEPQGKPKNTRMGGLAFLLYQLSYRGIPLHGNHPILKFFSFNTFIYFWLHWVFIAARRLSPVVVSRDFSCCRAQVLGCVGFSSCGTLA